MQILKLSHKTGMFLANENLKHIELERNLTSFLEVSLKVLSPCHKLKFSNS